MSSTEFSLWRLYDASTPALNLKVRYRDDVEEPDWQRGPHFQAALQQAAADGWEAFDSEPGNLLGEYAIVHLKRTR